MCFYENCTRSWITVDGRVVANLEFHLFGELTLSLPAGEYEAKRRNILVFSEPIPGKEIPPGAQASTLMELGKACWQYLHSSLNDSLRSPDPSSPHSRCLTRRSDARDSDA